MTTKPSDAAKESAVFLHDSWCGCSGTEQCGIGDAAEMIQGVIDEAVAAEREACATTAAIHSQYPATESFDKGYAKARKDAADAIRARAEPEAREQHTTAAKGATKEMQR